jgi:hypothetical protein
MPHGNVLTSGVQDVRRVSEPVTERDSSPPAGGARSAAGRNTRESRTGAQLSYETPSTSRASAMTCGDAIMAQVANSWRK